MNSIGLSRRAALKSGLAATALASLPGLTSGEDVAPARKNRIQQSACRWCYKEIPLDQLCAYRSKDRTEGH